MEIRRYAWENASGWSLLEWMESGVVLFEFGFKSREEAQDYGLETGDIPKAQAYRTDWMRDAVSQINKYFEGRLKKFDIPLDFFGETEFRQKVWREAAKIPYGKTISYSELAAAVGSPGGARAVGNALGANPVPVIVPCHRILKSDGALGGFSAGIDVKKALLALERGETADFSSAKFIQRMK